MRKRISLDGVWSGAYGTSCASPSRTADVALLEHMEATVPGTFESDLEKAGVLPELFYGDNILLAQDYENYHYCVSRTFDYAPEEGYADYLVFEGLDCFAEVFIDGVKIHDNTNMLIEQRIKLEGLAAGEHELFVHIRPATVESRKYKIQPYVSALKHGYDALYVRKAPSQYGWDIMPRLVSSGIWKHVYIDRLPEMHIDDVFMYTVSCDENHANISCTYNTDIGGANIHKCRLVIEGVCGESSFRWEDKLWHTGGSASFGVNNPKLWWPHNYGEPNLYTVTASLYYDGVLCDTYTTKFGIRTTVLDRTSTTDRDGNGQFRFIINGKPIFAMGSNWVPVDAVHSRDEERLPEILPMLSDLGCNIIRCWGGNVYENDILYDYCDSHGIMVWQDFTMACGRYPQDEAFKEMIREEIPVVVTRLRNHPAIVLWAGDNECDMSFGWGANRGNPNQNVITREIIPEALRYTDPSRPYLPSSPFVDEEAFRNGQPISEDHLWGPRDYFKGDYYRNTVCHFASETGYHGCPSVVSLKKYIAPEHLWPCLGDRHWLTHAATMEGEENSPYGYRIRLMWNQAVTLFGADSRALTNLDDFAVASQASQAEAKKYFIERFRLTKWRRTGIIWWNLIDGWPQISDAIVDYYLDKKLAYSYIKRSQQPVCMMFDEPKDGRLTLYAVNDTRTDRTINYTIEDDRGEVILSSTAFVRSDESAPAVSIPATDEKRYYIIRWNDGENEGMNHYFANIRDIDYDYYLTLLEKLK